MSQRCKWKLLSCVQEYQTNQFGLKSVLIVKVVYPLHQSNESEGRCLLLITCSEPLKKLVLEPYLGHL